MKPGIFFLALVVIFCSCATRKNLQSMGEVPKGFDWQGHRGCRGLMPENTVPAFLEALRYPVTTLEMDVVLSSDGEVVLSHEPWMNAVICSQPDGQPISKTTQEEFNLYRMTMEEIRRFDCGSKGNPQYPEQKMISAHKPSLSEVVYAVREYCTANDLKHPRFNIELKSRASWYNVFVPQPEVFVDRILTELQTLDITEHTSLQSFDQNVLRALHAKGLKHPGIVFLVEGNPQYTDAIEKLGFTPDVYSPYFSTVNAEMVQAAHARKVKVIPWTVNTVKDFNALIALGVDGIITDYPDLIGKKE